MNGYTERDTHQAGGEVQVIECLPSKHKVLSSNPVPPTKGRMWHANTTEYYSGFKKEILPRATTWMSVEDVMLSERSQSQKHNIILYMILLI
jgi:hypothetical protein